MNADGSGDQSASVPSASNLRDEIPERLSALARRILKPLARLFVAHGGGYAHAEQMLREAFLDAGQEELLRAGIEPNISRLGLSTGLHRKEVKRLVVEQKEQAGTTSRPSAKGSRGLMTSELYMLWSTGKRYSNRDGAKDLPMRSADGEPSFETLAREVSRDSHPRSMFEELKRLGLVQQVDGSDLVRLRPGGFVPLLEQTRLFELMSDNVADHFDTAASNIVSDTDKHLEQSIWLDGLSYESIMKIDALSRDIWAKATNTLVAAMIQHGTVDAESPDKKTYRVRVGMFTYSSAPRTEKERTAQAAALHQTPTGKFDDNS